MISVVHGASSAIRAITPSVSSPTRGAITACVRYSDQVRGLRNHRELVSRLVSMGSDCSPGARSRTGSNRSKGRPITATQVQLLHDDGRCYLALLLGQHRT